MTTPHIDDFLMEVCEPDTGLITIGKHDHDALRELLARAKQAGKDEERATVKEMVQEINGQMYFDHERLRKYIKDDTIKALQDNK